MNIEQAMDFTDEEILSGGRLNDDFIGVGGESRIYFLIDNGVVVYVGQTINLGTRRSQHKRDKSFDNISFICIPRELANDVEASYIVKFNPKYNFSLPRNSAYLSAGAIRELAKDMAIKVVSEEVRQIGIAYSGGPCGRSKKFNAEYLAAKDYRAIISKLETLMANIDLGE